jgi:four helix bundle protein
MDLIVECYQASERFPRKGVYGLCSQLQRAVVSVAANIAEGHGRTHTREFLHHLSIANGSLMEVETHVQIAGRLAYLDEAVVCQIMEHSGTIGRMINGLQRSLERRLSSPQPPDP